MNTEAIPTIAYFHFPRTFAQAFEIATKIMLMENVIDTGLYSAFYNQIDWQDTEKRDTFFLTIEGRALDLRPAAASIEKTVDDKAVRSVLQKAHQAREGRAYPSCRRRIFGC
ncbi:hypothetical protein [Mesorhizobium sp. Root157]|uniref:hypothetical protein n=1 Tax=Mesorhizobium sp. Root157 TaxID=1736477 RepID=UPI00138F3F86|nr:hypothetical protein [Mesorhizobium sp. Root157]